MINKRYSMFIRFVSNDNFTTYLLSYYQYNHNAYVQVTEIERYDFCGDKIDVRRSENFRDRYKLCPPVA